MLKSPQMIRAFGKYCFHADLYRNAFHYVIDVLHHPLLSSLNRILIWGVQTNVNCNQSFIIIIIWLYCFAHDLSSQQWNIMRCTFNLRLHIIILKQKDKSQRGQPLWLLCFSATVSNAGILLIHDKSAAGADAPAASANLVFSALGSLEAERRRRQALSSSHMGLHQVEHFT